MEADEVHWIMLPKYPLSELARVAVAVVPERHFTTAWAD